MELPTIITTTSFERRAGPGNNRRGRKEARAMSNKLMRLMHTVQDIKWQKSIKDYEEALAAHGYFVTDICDEYAIVFHEHDLSGDEFIIYFGGTPDNVYAERVYIA